MIEKLSTTFTANVRFAFTLPRKNKYIDEKKYKIILAFDANAKLLNFSEKLKTASGKYCVNMVTRSFLPFAVCRKRVA